MRIKKTFQGNLPENTVVNTHSNSQTNAYSCEYFNNKLAEIPTIQDGGNGWKKIEYSSYTEYFKNDITSTISFSGNGWGQTRLTLLPSNITFNSNKMSLSVSAKTDDNAIALNCCTYNSWSEIPVGWQNKYGGAVSVPIRYNCVLRVYK